MAIIIIMGTLSLSVMVGINKRLYGFPCLKNNFTVAFSLNTGHTYIHWYKAISTINPVKQPKHALELKLSHFKNFANCKILSTCLPV